MAAPVTVPPAVDAEDVSVVYGRGDKAVVALDGFRICVEANKFVALIGPSGCGKSSFLKAVSDLLPHEAVQGNITVNGKTPYQARLENSFAFVFQDPVLAPWRTVIQNVNLPLEVAGSGRSSEKRRSPEELLKLVGLENFSSALPSELSGGMRQRVALARALTLDPSILLMDEPFGALDELTRDRMHDELLQMWRSTDAAVLLVTHSIAEAVYLADEVVILSSRPGRLMRTVEIDLPRPRQGQIKTSIEFLEKTNEVRSYLDL